MGTPDSLDAKDEKANKETTMIITVQNFFLYLMTVFNVCDLKM